MAAAGGPSRTLVTSVLVRTLGGGFQEVEITDETPVSELLLLAEPSPEGIRETPLQLAHVEWCGSRIVKTGLLSPHDRVTQHMLRATPDNGSIAFAAGVPTDRIISAEGQAPAAGNQEGEWQASAFRHCQFWVVEKGSQTRFFLNPYIRMTLGLPMWFLDLYPTEHVTVAEMEAFLRECLGLARDDCRFRIFGQFRSHVSLLEERAWVRHLTMLEDPGNTHFWQFMMCPEAEMQGHLGISRQGPLLHRSGLQLSSKKYWFVLQGTTLSYYRNPRDRKWQRRIVQVDRCQIIYRGGNHDRTCFKMEIIEPETGRRHLCKSQSKRRIEKWIRALQASHTSCEILEPIDMETIAKLTGPQPHPPAVPDTIAMGTRGMRRSSRPSIMETLLGEEAEGSQAQAQGEDDLVAGVATGLKKIELAAETMSQRKKIRRREALLWSELIRGYLQTILRLDHIGYARAILPDLKSVVGEVRNFLDLAEGRSEFEPEMARAGAMVESIMDGLNCLFIIFRGAIEEGGGEACPSELHDTKQYRENKLLLMKARHALKKPYAKIKIDEGKGSTKGSVAFATASAISAAAKDGTRGMGKGAGKKSWWSWFQATKRKAAIPEGEVNDISITQTVPETTFYTLTEGCATEAGGVEEGEGEEAIRSLLTVEEAPRSIWSKWKFPFGGGKSPKPEQEENGAAVGKSGLGCTGTGVPIVKTTRFALDPDSSDSEEPAKGEEGLDPRLPTPFPQPNTAATSPLSHRRSQSLRSVSSAATAPPATLDGAETARRRNSYQSGGARRRSVVEIDQTLLGALLKDDRLAKMIQPRGDEHEGSGRNGIDQQPPPPPLPIPCSICAQLIKVRSDLIRTPFESFHQACLKCHTCGEQLSATSYNMERGRPTCRKVSCGARPASLNASAGQPQPLKSILKRPA